MAEIERFNTLFCPDCGKIGDGPLNDRTVCHCRETIQHRPEQVVRYSDHEADKHQAIASVLEELAEEFEGKAQDVEKRPPNMGDAARALALRDAATRLREKKTAELRGGDDVFTAEEVRERLLDDHIVAIAVQRSRGPEKSRSARIKAALRLAINKALDSKLENDRA